MTLTDPQAKILAHLAAHPSPSLRFDDATHDALLAGAAALEREARRRADETRETPPR